MPFEGAPAREPLSSCASTVARVELIWILIVAIPLLGPIAWGLLSKRGRDAAPEHDDSILDVMDVRRDGQFRG